MFDNDDSDDDNDSDTDTHDSKADQCNETITTKSKPNKRQRQRRRELHGSAIADVYSEVIMPWRPGLEHCGDLCSTIVGTQCGNETRPQQHTPADERQTATTTTTTTTTKQNNKYIIYIGDGYGVSNVDVGCNDGYHMCNYSKVYVDVYEFEVTFTHSRWAKPGANFSRSLCTICSCAPVGRPLGKQRVEGWTREVGTFPRTGGFNCFAPRVREQAFVRESLCVRRSLVVPSIGAEAFQRQRGLGVVCRVCLREEVHNIRQFGCSNCVLQLRAPTHGQPALTRRQRISARVALFPGSIERRVSPQSPGCMGRWRTTSDPFVVPVVFGVDRVTHCVDPSGCASGRPEGRAPEKQEVSNQKQFQAASVAEFHCAH